MCSFMVLLSDVLIYNVENNIQTYTHKYILSYNYLFSTIFLLGLELYFILYTTYYYTMLRVAWTKKDYKNQNFLQVDVGLGMITLDHSMDAYITYQSWLAAIWTAKHSGIAAVA